jgi:endonuclease-3 related protein
MMNLEDLHELYTLLFKQYGPQGWWPLLGCNILNQNPTGRGLCTGYHPLNYEIPTSDSEVLEIMLGCILTQNTSWINAEKALYKLNENNLLSLNALLKIPIETLAEMITSSGYYNQKAIKVKSLVSFLEENSISSLETKTAEILRTVLLSIKGVGYETADSVILYALKKPIFVVDTYTRRLLYRFGLISIDLLKPNAYNSVQSLFHQNLTPDLTLYNEFHALIVQHCVHVCEKNPHCMTCFLSDKCMKNILIEKKQKKGV